MMAPASWSERSAIEHAHRRLRDAHDHEGEEGHERERHAAHRGNPRRPEPRQEFEGSVHRVSAKPWDARLSRR